MLRKIAVNDALISVAQGTRVYLIKEMTTDTPVGDITGAEFAVWERMMKRSALTGVLMAQVLNHIAVLQRGKNSGTQKIQER